MDPSKLCVADEHKTETFCSTEHFKEHNEKLQVFFEDQQFCDITLISADNEYKVMAHKMFLASISKYFRAMFGGSLRESNSNEVKLSQIDGPSLKLILNFIYKGIIELSDDTVEPIFIASQFLELSALEKVCCGYMKKNIDVSNCLGISNLAERHNNKELYEAAMLCACENFVALRSEDEFVSQSFDQLCELISRDELRVSSECQVFHSILKWVNHKKDDRKQFWEKLLDHVRFPLIPPSFIAEVIGEVTESYEALRVVRNAFIWHTVPKMRSTIFSREQCKIRNFKDVIVAINGCENSETELSVGLYYSGLNEWIYVKWPAIPHTKKNYKYTLFNDKLLIVESTFPTPVDCLNLKSLEWTEFPHITTFYIPPNHINPVSTIDDLIALRHSVCAISGNSISTLKKPFENWEPFEVRRTQTPGFHLPNTCAYATYGNTIYFPETNGEFYGIYDVHLNLLFERALRRINVSNAVIGLEIIRSEGVDYLIEIGRSVALVYNLATKLLQYLTEIEFHPSCRWTSRHGNNVIIYGPNKFYEYVFPNRMFTLPDLINDKKDIILLTDRSSGLS